MLPLHRFYWINKIGNVSSVVSGMQSASYNKYWFSTPPVLHIKTYQPQGKQVISLLAINSALLRLCSEERKPTRPPPQWRGEAGCWTAAAGSVAWLLIIQEPIYDKHRSLPLHDKAYGSTEPHYPKKTEHCGRRGQSRVHTHKRTLWGCLHNPAVLLADFLPRRHLDLTESAADICSFNMASGRGLEKPGVWSPLLAIAGTACQGCLDDEAQTRSQDPGSQPLLAFPP